MTPDEIRKHLFELGDVARAVPASNSMTGFGQLGKYRVEELLGHGGESVVLRAWDTDLQRDVVLKFHYDATTPEMRERVLREGRSLARVDNRYVARCHTVETFADAPCLVLEYVSGTSLSDRIQRGDLGAARSTRIVQQLAEGLAAIHERGIVHRDLKPSNVVITADGSPKIIDFGLASTGNRSAGDTSGTAVYLAPERARGDSNGDERSDIFGLGTILYEMLTGSPPFDAETKEQSLEHAANCRLRHPLPNPKHPVTRICMKCLAPEPSQRFSTATQVASALNEANSRSMYRWKVFAASIAVVLMIVMAGHYFGTPNAKSLEEQVASSVLPNIARNDVIDRVIWVDGSQSQSGDGTRQKPFQSVAAAIHEAGPEYTVRVRGVANGKQIVYQEPRLVLGAKQHKAVRITNWGEHNPEHLARPGVLPLLTGSNDEDSLDELLGCYASRAEISGLAFRCEGTAVLVSRGPHTPPPQFVTIGGCQFVGHLGTGIRIENAHDTSIDDVQFHNLRGEGPNAVSIVDTDGVVISHAEVREIEGIGIYVSNSRRVKILDGSFSGATSCGLFLTRSDDVAIRGNMIHGCDVGMCLRGPGAITSLAIRNYIVSECTQGISIAKSENHGNLGIVDLDLTHNTVYRTGGIGIEVVVSTAKNVSICRNISVENRWGDIHVGDGIDPLVQNNLFRKESVVPGHWRFSTPNFWVPGDEDGHFPQLRIQDQDGDPLNAMDRMSYAPLATSVANNIRVETSHGSSDPIDIFGNERDATQPDLGAIEVR